MISSLRLIWNLILRRAPQAGLEGCRLRRFGLALRGSARSLSSGGPKAGPVSAEHLQGEENESAKERLVLFCSIFASLLPSSLAA
jgi:hypothetical protein